MLLFACALALAAGDRAAPVGAASAQLAFSPAFSSTSVGGTVPVEVTVANVNNLGGYDVFVQFNQAVVRMTSLTDAGFVTGAGNIVVCNPATINNTAGTATASCATISPFGTPAPGVTTVAPTPLLHASLLAVTPGVSPLTLTATELHDPDGALIPAKLGIGSVIVSGAVGGVAHLSEAGQPAKTDHRASPGGLPVRPLVLVVSLSAAVVLTGLVAHLASKSRAK